MGQQAIRVEGMTGPVTWTVAAAEICRIEKNTAP